MEFIASKHARYPLEVPIGAVERPVASKSNPRKGENSYPRQLSLPHMHCLWPHPPFILLLCFLHTLNSSSSASSHQKSARTGPTRLFRFRMHLISDSDRSWKPAAGRKIGRVPLHLKKNVHSAFAQNLLVSTWHVPVFPPKNRFANEHFSGSLGFGANVSRLCAGVRSAAVPNKLVPNVNGLAT